MDKKFNQKKYQKINLYNYYNKKYYDDNISEITDSDYDKLKKTLLI